MVAYNMMLSVFPLALVGAVRRRTGPDVPGRRGVGRRRPPATVPAGGGVDDRSTACGECASRRRRSAILAVDRVDVVRVLLLGRARHRVLPHLPARVPDVGAAETLRARDARGRAAVLRRDGEHPALQELVTRTPRTCRSGSGSVRGLVYGVSLVGGLVLLFAILCVIYWRVPRGGIPWRCIWPGALLGLVGMAIVDYGFPSTCTTCAAAGRDVVRVHPHRARLVLRARADPARGRGTERAAFRGGRGAVSARELRATRADTPSGARPRRNVGHAGSLKGAAG